MIEVAVVSMEEALRADGGAIPVGSLDIEREPLVLAGASVVAAPEPAPVDRTRPDA
jgi:hypothetical protein